jgi:deoxyribonuclease-4
MAGKGSEVGRDFGELRAIIDAFEAAVPEPVRKLSPQLGVCLDTCHIWDGGYDIVGDLDGVLDDFDRVVGLDRLKAIHLNDSMNSFAAHKDRHACLGEGKIGKDALARIINHPKLRDLPFYLETPNDLDGYRAEIAMLRDLREYA